MIFTLCSRLILIIEVDTWWSPWVLSLHHHLLIEKNNSIFLKAEGFVLFSFSLPWLCEFQNVLVTISSSSHLTSFIIYHFLPPLYPDPGIFLAQVRVVWGTSGKKARGLYSDHPCAHARIVLLLPTPTNRESGIGVTPWGWHILICNKNCTE